MSGGITATTCALIAVANRCGIAALRVVAALSAVASPYPGAAALVTGAIAVGPTLAAPLVIAAAPLAALAAGLRATVFAWSRLTRFAPLVLAATPLALLAATVDAEQFQFVDEWTAENIPAYGLTHAALSVVKPDNLTRGPHSLLGAVRYATLTFRDSEGVELPVVVVLVEWPSGRSALYIDADADGKLSNRERAEAIDPSMSPPGFAGGQDRVWLARLTRPFARTAAFRLTEDGTQLTCALTRIMHKRKERN